MKSTRQLVVLLYIFLSVGIQACESPTNQDLSNLINLSKNAIAAGKQGDAQAFVEKTNIASEALKKHHEESKGCSAELSRASTKLKDALKAAKAQNFQEGINELEQAVTLMQKKQ